MTLIGHVTSEIAAVQKTPNPKRRFKPRLHRSFTTPEVSGSLNNRDRYAGKLTARQASANGLESRAGIASAAIVP